MASSLCWKSAGLSFSTSSHSLFSLQLLPTRLGRQICFILKFYIFISVSSFSWLTFSSLFSLSVNSVCMLLNWQLSSTMTVMSKMSDLVFTADSFCKTNTAISLGCELILFVLQIYLTLANMALVLVPRGIHILSHLIKRDCWFICQCSTRGDVPVVLSLMLQLLLHVSHMSLQFSSFPTELLLQIHTGRLKNTHGDSCMHEYRSRLSTALHNKPSN